MVKCPKCGKEINYLVNMQSGYMGYKMDKAGNYGTGEFNTDGRENVWWCPKCRENLFKDKEEAIKFLKGE